MPYDVIIIGAGLSGLSAAYGLVEKGITHILLIDAQNTPGGKVHSLNENGFVFENGPLAFQGSSKNLFQLCEKLNLPLQAADPCGKYRFIYHNGQLCPIPMDPISLITTPLLSFAGKLRLISEPFRNSKPQSADETISEFAKRRLGQEVLDNLLGPFLSGIYAGDPDIMSIRAMFPKLTEWEDQHGSVIKGAFHMLLNRPKTAKPTKKPTKRIPSYQLFSFPGGLQTLANRLVETLPPGSTRFGDSVVTLKKKPQGHYEVTLASGETLETNALVLAAPTDALANLLETHHPQLAEPFSRLGYAPLASVHVAFEKSTFPHALNGFGFLKALSEKPEPIIGCIWASSLFPDRAPEGQVLLSCYVGGRQHPDLLDLSDAELIERTVASLRRIFKTANLQATTAKVMRHPKALPLYQTGHVQTLQAIQQQLEADFPNVHLVGNFIQGVSMDRCVERGLAVAKAINEPISKNASLLPV